MKSKFEEIKDDLLEAIEKGIYKKGDKIPSESELCRQYNTSRITVRRALDELTMAGLLYRSQGLGSFVNDRLSNPVSEKVALILPMLVGAHLGDRIVIEMIQSMRKEFNSVGISLLEFLEPTGEAEIPEFIQNLKDIGIKGICYMSYYRILMQDELLKLGCPVVFIDTEPENNMFDLVTGEDYLSAYRAVQMLLGRGVKKIGFFSPWETSFTTTGKRLEGVRDALADSGIEYRQEWLYTFGEKRDVRAEEEFYHIGIGLMNAANEYLRHNAELEGIVAACDSAAAALLVAAGQLDICVPENLKIISYGNYFSRQAETRYNEEICQITSYEQNFDQYGEEAAKLLISRIQGKLPGLQQKRVVKYTLIRKDSF